MNQKDNPTLKRIRDALRDGNLQSADIQTLKQNLKEVHQVIRLEEWVNERAELINSLQYLIELKESGRTLCWARIAGIAGIAGVIVAVVVAWLTLTRNPDASTGNTTNSTSPTQLSLPSPQTLSTTNGQKAISPPPQAIFQDQNLKKAQPTTSETTNLSPQTNQSSAPTKQ